MGWFIRWFSSFFKRAAKTAIGIAAESISNLAVNVVFELEQNKNLDGVEKRDIAFGMIKKQYPDIKAAAINLAIETALAIVIDKIKNK